MYSLESTRCLMLCHPQTRSLTNSSLDHLHLSMVCTNFLCIPGFIYLELQLLSGGFPGCGNLFLKCTHLLV